MATISRVDPGWSWAKRFRISMGIRAGDTLYISGQVAFDDEGDVVGRRDMKAQAQQVFHNIRTVVEAAGGSMDDIVKITAYLTDMDRYAGYAEARGEAFPGVPPASTTVAVSGLVDPDLLVEVEAMAVVQA